MTYTVHHQQRATDTMTYTSSSFAGNYRGILGTGCRPLPVFQAWLHSATERHNPHLYSGPPMSHQPGLPAPTLQAPLLSPSFPLLPFTLRTPPLLFSLPFSLISLHTTPTSLLSESICLCFLYLLCSLSAGLQLFPCVVSWSSVGPPPCGIQHFYH